MGFNQSEFGSINKGVFVADGSSFVGNANASNSRPSVPSPQSSSSFDIQSFLDFLSNYENNSALAQWTAQTLSDQAAMKFESDEASALRTWMEKMQLDAQNFNAAQAGLNRAFQKSSAESAMRFEREEREYAQDFSKMMSDTAYQRAVNDLKAAGLNPILAYTQGGASTPTVQGGQGFTSPGSAASVSSVSAQKGSGKSSSRSKANISSIASSVLNYSSNIVSNSAKMLSAIGQIIPG